MAIIRSKYYNFFKHNSLNSFVYCSSGIVDDFKLKWNVKHLDFENSFKLLQFQFNSVLSANVIELVLIKGKDLLLLLKLT